MDTVSLYFGLGLGIIIGALIQEWNNAKRTPPTGEMSKLFKDACDDLKDNESVSVTLTGGKYKTDDGGGGGYMEALPPELADNYRNN